ncbi:MAG: hypothetical protein BM555_05580 [Crocinitomix sp. MedPE-SWsnd]|nr:MAG: hypothetical protein BM555_05580 [Crocinitomix sp. MedPE-SWsnd]
METCYKLVPTEIFKSLNLVEQRFGFEPEITAKFKKLKWLRCQSPAIQEPKNRAKKSVGKMASERFGAS